MKLPAAKPASTEFTNAVGSDVPEEFALAARNDVTVIEEMADGNPEDLEKLRAESLKRAYVICIDKSYSMSLPDKDGRTRWESARMAVETMLPVIFKHDADGSVPLFFFDSGVHTVGECTDAGQVFGVFNSLQPSGSTNLGACLELAMETYLGSKRPNYNIVPGTTFIVLLDGGADNVSHVKDVIKKYSNPVNKYISNSKSRQAAVTFIQIGDDKGATDFLKDLDDNMGPPEEDICDTNKDDLLYEPNGVEILLAKAIFD